MLCVTLRPIPVAPGVLPAFLLLWNGICRILPDPCPALSHLDATLTKNARGGTGTVKLEARAFARGPKGRSILPCHPRRFRWRQIHITGHNRPITKLGVPAG